MDNITEGWAIPGSARKAHYFVDKQALCGKWLFGGYLEQGNDDSPDNCPSCMKLLQKRNSTRPKGE
jgi:hypothetical protein